MIKRLIDNKIFKIISIFITICSFCILFLISIKSFNQQIEIKDIRKKEIIILRKNLSQRYIHNIKINISGTIKGQSTISLILNNKEYKINKLNGDFSFNWGGDWYDDTAKIIYQPISTQNGNVTIQYKFEG